MAKTVFIFYTNCRDPKREKELSDWYNNIHIPDVEALPGFTTCIRYRITDKLNSETPAEQPHDATYVSIVEADLNTADAISILQDGVADWHKRGRMSDLFIVTSSAVVSEENPSARRK